MCLGKCLRVPSDSIVMLKTAISRYGEEKTVIFKLRAEYIKQFGITDSGTTPAAI